MKWQLMWRNVRTAVLNATLQVLVIYKYILMILIWLPNGGLLNILNTKFGFWCFLSLITEFLLLITKKWWVPWSNSLFGCVFRFCFQHSILTKVR